MIYHLRNVRNWADFVAEVGDFSRAAPRCGGATIINGAGHRFQCSAVARWRFRHLFGYLFGTVYATPHGELRRALGNQAHRASLQYPSACPVASRTMKWASVSSAVQDGGKRRGLISSSLLRLGASWQVPSGS